MNLENGSLPVRIDKWPKGLATKLTNQTKYIEKNWDLICSMTTQGQYDADGWPKDHNLS